MPLQSQISAWLCEIFQRLFRLHFTFKNGGKLSRKSISLVSSSQGTKCVEANLGSSKQEGRRPSNECFTSLPLVSFLYCSHYSPTLGVENRAWTIKIFLFLAGISTMSSFWWETLTSSPLLWDLTWSWSGQHHVNYGWYLDCLKKNTIASKF
jgi:hypothetical protein